MEPAPAKTELPPKKNPETKPFPSVESADTASKPGKTAESTSLQSPDLTTPRGKLEAIANGTPASEVFAESKPEEPKTQEQSVKEAMESAPDREQMTKLLEETNALLLELRDMRLFVTAIATQAADTPLGNETRIDALRLIRDMGHEGLPPEKATAVTALQEKIKALNIPEAKPQNSALLPIISKYNETHPNAQIPQQIIEQIQTGQKDSASTVAQFMQSNPDLAQDVWKQLTNVDGFTGIHPTPENILALAGLPATPENTAKAQELFGTISRMNQQEQLGVMDIIGPKLLTGALLLIFVSQIATGQEGGGH